MKKQLLLFVMIVLPVVAYAADVVIDGIYYNLSKSENVAVVTYRDDNYNSYSGDVAIPSSFIYGGTEYKVTKIGGWAFRNCGNLTTVIIPESVTVIGNGAFQYCTDLNSVTIPNSVYSICPDAFANCSGLTSVTIPNSVTYLGENAFRSCI